jgi:PAS domain S-box-containing protein
MEQITMTMHSSTFKKLLTPYNIIVISGVAFALISTILYVWGNLPWVSFLAGILIASIITEFVRGSRSEWVLLRRTAQLAALKKKMLQETDLRKHFEHTIAKDKLLYQLVNEKMSKIVVLIDNNGLCQFHNRAFREWLDLPENSINGLPLRKLLGSKAYADIATAVQQSLDGKSLRYEHVQTMSWGYIYRLSVEHVPVFDESGKQLGFYFLADDITRSSDLTSYHNLDTRKANVADAVLAAQQEQNPEEPQLADLTDAGIELIRAIQDGDFILYCQLITSLPVTSGNTSHYETRCSSFLRHSELAMVILSRDCPAKKRRGRLLAA